MGSRIRVGVIGTGRIGRLHTEHLAFRIPGAEVVAVSDIFIDSARKAAADFRVPDAVKDADDIIKRKDVDAVIICSSTDTHAGLIGRAAAAGKHIFCEKPIALDLAEIDRALEDVDRAGVKLQIGFNRRFDPNYRRVWELVRNGTIGEPHILRITSRDPAPPPVDYVKVSGGLFLDMMIHDFDMARYLTGSEAEYLFTEAAVMVDPKIGEAGDVDTAVVVMKFKNGVIGTIDNSRKAVFGYDQRVEMFGSEGMAVSENNRPNTVRVSGPDSVSEDLPLNFFMERYIESYLSEMKEFLKCIVESRTPPVTGIDGRVPVVMGIAARMSLERKEPVYLEEIEP